MHICKYCNKEFETYQKLGGHIIHCKLNPNYEQSLKQLEEARKNIKNINIIISKLTTNKRYYYDIGLYENILNTEVDSSISLILI